MTSTRTPAAELRPIECLETRIAPAAAIFDLGAINGTNGFKLNGVAADDGAGISVSAAGDINSDGFADLIVGARGADPGGRLFAGTSYVVFGKATPFAAGFDLATLDGTNGFRINGELADDFSGTLVTRAGDVSGDGIDDLLVAAYGHDPGGLIGAGAVYIVYGKTTAFAADLELSSPTVTKIGGAATADRFGFAAAAAGDVNRDGRADLIIGAPSHNPGGTPFAGASYVVFGQTGGLGASVSLASLNGVTGFKITGEAEDDFAGRSVSGAGDINGDGFADLLIGAYGVDANGNDYAGAAYVVFGKASGFAATLALSSLNGANGFQINGEAANDYAGWSVSGAGDINGDGLADLLIGARDAAPGGVTQAGAAYVVFGKKAAFAATLDLSALTGANGFEISGFETFAQLGRTVAAAGDVNGDRIADLLIGAHRAAPNGDALAGSTFVIFGKKGAFSATLNPATLDGFNGFRINGDAAGDQAAFGLAAAGDVNGDGVGDLFVGAFGATTTGGAGSGAAYVLYGARDPVLSADKRSATLLDTDGDIITVRVTRGQLGVQDFTTGDLGRGLLKLNLADDGQEFAGASIIISARRVAGGDGRVNVGAIDAAGVDLGAVTVSGDLGQIDAGNVAPGGNAIARLSVGSLGVVAGTQLPGTVDPFDSRLVGNLGAFVSGSHVRGDLAVSGAIGPVLIGGHLDGSTGGLLRADGNIAALTVRGSVLETLVLAGFDETLTQTAANASIGRVTVSGDWNAALLQASGNIGNVSVVRNFIGTADPSGISAGGKLGRVTIGLNLKSADPAEPVTIFAKGKAGAIGADAIAIAGVNIGGNVLNARILADSLTNATNQTNSNAGIGIVTVRGNWTDSHLQSTGNISGVTVGNNFTGDDDHGIVAGLSLGRVTINGDLEGASLAAPVTIQAVGKLGATRAAEAVAIASLIIRGNVENAAILGGYSPSLGAVNRDASIGLVSVGGTWTASDLVAGVADAPADGFGRNDLAIATNNQPGLLARIASVTIRGAALGGASSHFGITAEQVVAATIHGVRQPLTAATPQNLLLDPANNNFRLVEL